MGTKEAAGYKEKIDTAWDDIYMGDKGSSSGRSDIRKFLKVAGGLGIANLYGSRQVEKYGNDALSRANDIRLDLQQQELMLRNDIRDASVVGNREKGMQDTGYDYTDPAQIMDYIVNNPDTGLLPKEVKAWKERYGSAGVGLATDAYNWEDGSVAREIFNNETASRVINLFNDHTRKAAKYKSLRSERGFMPYITKTSEGKVIDDQGYLNNVTAALANIDAITSKLQKTVPTMKWTDGILLKLGIKKLDRDFIIKEQIANEVNKQAGAEVKRRLQFDLKRTGADENLVSQLALRIENNIDGDIKDMTIPEAFEALDWLTKTGDASAEDYISMIADQAVTNTLKGDGDINMAGIIKTLPPAGTYLTNTEVQDILGMVDLDSFPEAYERITAMLTPKEGEVRPFYTAQFEVIDWLLKNPKYRKKNWTEIKAEAEAFKLWYSSKLQDVVVNIGGKENNKGEMVGGKDVALGTFNRDLKIWEVNPDYVEEAKALGLDELNQRKIFRQQGDLFNRGQGPQDITPEFETLANIIKSGFKPIDEALPKQQTFTKVQQDRYDEFVEDLLPSLLGTKTNIAQLRATQGVAFLDDYTSQQFNDMFDIDLEDGALYWDMTSSTLFYKEKED
jgi:hypothetical protein